MQSRVPSGGRQDVYGAITDKIVAAIEAGAGNFVMPWHRISAEVGRPANAQSRTRYQGINVLALWAAGMTLGYGSGWWATYRQWDELGAQVRRGEHGTTIVFYKSITELDGEEQEVRERLIARAFRVFNAEQVDGWELPTREEAPVEKSVVVESFIVSTRAEIRHGGDHACYRRDRDRIEVPHPHQFKVVGGRSSTEAYYATVLHELTHWTGATNRLDREFGKRFGDDAYAVEELVAELGAAFLCADLAISNEPRPDHAAYLASWLRVLKADRRAIFTAAQKAKEAATYLAAFSTP